MNERPTTTDDELLAETLSAAMVRASDVLAEMSGRPIRISTPSIDRCSPDDVAHMAGGAEVVVVAVYLGILGALSGHALLLLEPDSARRLAGFLLDSVGSGRPVESEGAVDLDDLGRSALGEIGNVTVSAFLNELGRRSSLAILTTPPQVVVEMAGAVIDAAVSDVVGEQDRVLAAHTIFHDGEDRIHALLLVLPELGSLQRLLTASDPRLP
jgi:chemotaxis protein CheC